VKGEKSMNEIPLPYVKFNQIGIVLFIAAAVAFHQPWILAVLWMIQTVGFWRGSEANLFFIIARSFLNTAESKKQAAELQRFNNGLSVFFLSLALASFCFDADAVGYIFSALLLIAVISALCGYCIGCTIYFQYKRFLTKRR
jgi:signal transduction histidine kinase